MTYAIIETGGKQLRVEPGRFYDIELLSTEPDQTVTLETVLLVQHNGDVTVGQPFIDGATVEGTVLRHFRGRKVLVYKMKPKKKTRKKRGHRQEITRLMINSISLSGSVLTSEEAAIDETQPDNLAVAEPAIEVAAEVLPETTAAEVSAGAAIENAAETAAEIAAEYAADSDAEVAAEVAAEVVENAAEPQQ